MIPPDDRDIEDTREPPDELEEGQITKEEEYWAEVDWAYDTYMDK